MQTPQPSPAPIPGPIQRPNAVPERAPEQVDRVLAKTKTSRLAYIIHYLIALVLIITPLVFMGTLEYYLGFYYLIVPALGVILILIMEFYIRTREELIVKESGVTEKRGIFSKQELSVDYTDITAVTVRQGILGRILRYGELQVGIKASTAPLKFPKTSSPGKVKMVIDNQIRSGFQQPRTPQYRQPPQPPSQPPQGYPPGA